MYKRVYFENAVICGNCNGAGLQGYMDYCRACGGKGVDSLEVFRRYHNGDPIAIVIEYKACIKELLSNKMT